MRLAVIEYREGSEGAKPPSVGEITGFDCVRPLRNVGEVRDLAGASVERSGRLESADGRDNTRQRADGE